MKPLPPPNVPGDTEAARMDAAVRMFFKTSKQDFLKAEAKKTEEKRRAKESKKKG